MAKIGELYRLVQVLSLDVVAGALASTLFIAQYLNVTLPLSVLITLGAAVWVIYTTDHLLDAKSIQHKAHTLRHRFHQEHSKKLTWAVAVVGIIGAVGVYFLPVVTIQYGLTLTIVVGLYFLVLKLTGGNLLMFKEVSIATIYTLGIFLGPFSLAHDFSDTGLWLLLTEYLLLAYINLLEFSLYDASSDAQDQQRSAVSAVGKSKIYWMITLLFVLLFTCMSVGVFYWLSNAPLFVASQWVILLMTLGLLAVLIFRKQLERRQYYRILGDAVFLFPIIGLF
ncbi:hypothetical protein V6R21_17125 [Limibacter armeniacum]|uniref:hypothetical protein n=1 Tax=Limibacter armeniacum TaxID=466084 RepID=UPI002FE61F3E